jgi:serine/threonine protein kinase
MWYSFKQDLKYFTEIEDFGEEAYGFIYKIQHKESKRYYIGKKILHNTTNVKLGVKETKNLPVQKGRKPTTKQVIKESNWKTYWGSNKDFLEYIKGKKEEEFNREVLCICNSKLELTYWETHHLFTNKVLFDELSYNSNILGKFYKGKLATQ